MEKEARAIFLGKKAFEEWQAVVKVLSPLRWVELRVAVRGWLRKRRMRKHAPLLYAGRLGLRSLLRLRSKQEAGQDVDDALSQWADAVNAFVKSVWQSTLLETKEQLDAAVDAGCDFVYVSDELASTLGELGLEVRDEDSYHRVVRESVSGT